MLLYKDGVGSIVEPTSSLVWADVILADFQRVTSRYLQDINTYLPCTVQRMLRNIYIYMHKSKLKYASLPSKIVEVWIDRFCVRYDWSMTSAAADVISVPRVINEELSLSLHCICWCHHMIQRQDVCRQWIYISNIFICIYNFGIFLFAYFHQWFARVFTRWSLSILYTINVENALYFPHGKTLGTNMNM